jgi:hypothetical protein
MHIVFGISSSIAARTAWRMCNPLSPAIISACSLGAAG